MRALIRWLARPGCDRCDKALMLLCGYLAAVFAGISIATAVARAHGALP
jgi:hypothetical protein